jgi:holo-[acyl-carrier protein] synthase
MIVGHGIDIIEISRIKDSIDRFGDVFLRKILHSTEFDIAKTHKQIAQYVAGRFAAKEAIYKAMGDKQLSWHDVAIINDSEGKPICQWHYPFEHQLILSISHTHQYAVASAIITQE